METKLRSVAGGILGSNSICDFDETMSILVGHHINRAPAGHTSVGIDYVKMVAKHNLEKK